MKLSDIISSYESRQEYLPYPSARLRYFHYVNCITKAKITGICKPGQFFESIIFDRTDYDNCLRFQYPYQNGSDEFRSLKFLEADIDLYFSSYNEKNFEQSNYNKWEKDKLPLP